MKLVKSVGCLLALCALSSPAQAHFKLLSPTSWLKEGSQGEPQKGSPCGPGGFDDSGQPAPVSNEITTVHAGDTIMVEVEETIHHPGWFRVALDADRTKFVDPTFMNADCTTDIAAVPTGAHDNVLADGLAKNMELAGANRTIKEMVTIPDTPCEKCTLQVIQVMADAVHRPPNCIYYHCADLKILPKDGAASGAAGSGTAGSSGSGAAGTGAGTSGASGSVSAAGSGGASGSSTSTAAGSPAAGSSAAGASVAAAGTGAAGKSTSPSSAGAAGSKTTSSTTNGLGTAGTPSASTTTPAATSTPTSSPSNGSSGGCAVARASSAQSSAESALLLLAALGYLVERRRARKSRRA